MPGLSAISAPPSAPFSGASRAWTVDQDAFKLAACRAHIVRKAEYKPLGNGLFVRTGCLSKIKSKIQGNTADARYRRAAYESSQRISAACLIEQHIARVQAKPVDLSASKRVRSRFYLHDNLRFNPWLASKQAGLSQHDQRAVKLARWAHHANGITELGAAPTGLLLKISKILTTPNRDDKSLGSQLRVLAVLPLVAAVVAQISSSVFLNGLGKLVKAGSSQFVAEIRALALGLNAVTFLSALISLVFVASSVMTAQKGNLSPVVLGMVQSNRDKHIRRIHALLEDVKDKPDAIHLLSRAMARKIPEQYRVNQGKTPWLLHRLLQDVRQGGSSEATRHAIATTLGSYLSEHGFRGDTPGVFLDSMKDQAELLSRERHFLALTNLIEHADLDKSADPAFKDCRHRIEAGAEHARNGVLKRSAYLLDKMGFSGTAEKARYLASTEYKNQRDLDRRNPALAARFRYSADNILENAHQYGPVTRSLARMSEGLRIFSHHVLMSLNYQLTRPVAAFSGLVMEKVFKQPNSRSVSFSIGRAAASAELAAMESVLWMSLSTGNGIGFGGPEAPTQNSFPLEVSMGKWTVAISVVSTAAHMLIVGLPAALLMGAAKAACYLEGWQGNIARPVEMPGSWRQPLRWG